MEGNKINILKKIRNFIKSYYLDIIIGGAISIITGYLSFKLGTRLNPFVFMYESFDTWFDSDVPRVIESMANLRANADWRGHVHPVFTLFMYPPTFFFQKIFNFSPVIATRAVISGLTVIWTGCFYLLMRTMDNKRFDSILFTILALISSGAIFWLIIPETFIPGSITIILGLIFSQLSEKQNFSDIQFAFVSAITLFFTVTNWMVGLIFTFLHKPIKRAIQISVKAFTIVTSLWFIQKFFFSGSEFFLNFQKELGFVNMQDRGTIWNIFSAFFFHSIVMPSIQISERIHKLPYIIYDELRVQQSLIGSGSAWGIFASILWGFLIIFGLIQIIKVTDQDKFKWVLGLSIIGQFVLHVFYGDETFLYALHYFPMLIALASFSLKSQYRKIILVVVVALIISASINNFAQLQFVMNFYS